MKWRWRRTSLAVKKGDNAQLWWRLQGREREGGRERVVLDSESIDQI